MIYMDGCEFAHCVEGDPNMLATQDPDWRFLRTDTNPFLSGRSAA